MATEIPDAELIQDLKRLAAGDLGGMEFLAKYMVAQSRVLNVIWGNLHHYVADADIRAKDPEYKKMQDREFARLIHLIEDGASQSELGKVTFLGRSE